MVLRLFISHSSPTPPTQGRLRALVEAIEQAAGPETIRVLVDYEQILGGDDWRRRIAFMLNACHAGIVLLDDAALASKWVLAETTFLSLRHLAIDSFGFLPVSFLDEPDLNKARAARAAQRDFLRDTSWDVVQLPGVQYVRGRTPEQVGSEVVRVLRHRGWLTPTPSPVDRLADQLSPKLTDVGPRTLQELADQMADARDYIAQDTRSLAALALVRHMLRCGLLASTRCEMDRFGTAFPDLRRREILEELAPLPIDPEAAVALIQRRSSGGYGHVSLYTDVPTFTIPLYVRRAHLAWSPPLCLAIENTFGTVEDLRAKLREEWRRRHPPLVRPLTDAQVDAKLNRSEGFLYVWVPGPLADDVLVELDRAYPRVTFIIQHGEGQEPAVLPPGVLPVTPALDQAREDAIVSDYEDAMSSLAEVR
jgi:TIR domain